MKIYLSPSDQDRNLYAYGNTTEKIQCCRIADECEKALKRCGFEVINNQTDTMEERVTEANSWGADLHLPIHTNAYDGEVSGTRMFYYSAEGSGRRACEAIFTHLAPITPGTSENIRMAPDLYELRCTLMTAAYIEVDFHDVPDVAKWIIEHVTDIGEAIAAGVCDFYGVEYKKEDTMDDFEKKYQEYRKELQDNDAGAWSQEARDWAVKTGLISGGTPLPDGTPNYMWQDIVTREQLVSVLYRFAKMMGKA